MNIPFNGHKGHLLGRQGEQIARKYLELHGYEVLETNWRYKKAEVDVIAYKHGTVVFIEVKTRSSVDYGMPEEAVNHTKLKMLELASDQYINMISHKGEIRYDIIAIIFENEETYTLDHIEDAFWPE